MKAQFRILLMLGLVIVVGVAGALWWFSTHSVKPPAALAQDALPEGFVAIQPPLQVGAVEVLNTGGKRVALGDFKGKPVVLNVWAKWCAPCVIELPKLDQLQEKVGADLMAVVTVAVDEPDGDKVRNFLANRGWHNLPPYYDPENQLARVFKIKSIPVSVLIDRNGFAVARADAPVDWYSDFAFVLLNNTILKQP